MAYNEATKKHYVCSLPWWCKDALSSVFSTYSVVCKDPTMFVEIGLHLLILFQFL
jgi:hypothetical protein